MSWTKKPFMLKWDSDTLATDRSKETWLEKIPYDCEIFLAKVASFAGASGVKMDKFYSTIELYDSSPDVSNGLQIFNSRGYTEGRNYMSPLPIPANTGWTLEMETWNAVTGHKVRGMVLIKGV